MKRKFFVMVGKFILWVSPTIWNLKGKFWFNLHQAMGRFVITLNSRHQLNLFEEEIG